MASVGYATLQIAPSLRGMQGAMQRQLSTVVPPVGRQAGGRLGAAMAAGTASAVAPMRSAGQRMGHALTSRIPPAARSAFSRVGALAAGAGAAMSQHIGSGAQSASRSVSTIGSSFRSMAGVATAALATIGIARFGKQILDTASGAQRTRAVLDGMYKAAGHGAGESTKLTKLLNQEFGRSQIAMTAFQQGAQDLAYLGLNAKESTRLMKQLEGTIVATGGSAEDMQAVTDALQSIQNRGKATLQELNIISGRGVPIMDMLADRLGVSIPKAMEMVTAGAVDINDVLGAMEAQGGTWSKALQDSAGNVGTTFSGAWAKMKNTLINGLANQVLPLLNRLAPAMTSLGNRMGNAMENLPAALSRVKAAMDRHGITDALRTIGRAVASLVKGARPFFKAFATGLAVAFGALVLALAPVARLLTRVGEWMQKHPGIVKTFATVLGVLVGVFIAFKAAIAIGGLIAALANPVGLVIVAIAALAAGLKYAWENSATFRRVVTDSWEDIQKGWTKLWALLKPGLEALQAGFMERWPEIKYTLLGIWKAIQVGAQFYFTYISTIIKAAVAVITWVWQNFGTHIVAYLKGVWTLISGVISGAMQVIMGVINIVMGIITGDWRRAWRGVGQIAQGQWKIIKGIVLGGAKIVIAILNAAWSAVIKVTKGAWRAVRIVLANTWSWVKNTARTTWTVVRNFILRVARGIHSGVRSTLVAMRRTIAAIWRGIRTATANAWNSIRRAVINRMSSLMSSVRKLPSRIVKVFRRSGEWLYIAGRNLIVGLMNGIWSRAKDLYRSLRDLGKNALRAAKNALGIRSPSTVFRDQVGRQVAQGIAAGLDMEQAGLDRRVANLVKTPAVPASPEVRGHAQRTGAAGQGQAPVEVHIDAAGADRALAQWLRTAVRVEGGGDVQKAFGRR